MFENRPYQTDMIHNIYEGWAEGHKNILAVLPTGSGKTHIFSKIIQEHVGPSAALAHRQELIGQVALALARNGVFHRIIAQPSTIKNIINIQMMELGRSFYDSSAQCGVVAVGTLTSKRGMKIYEAWCKTVTLFVPDESHHCLRENLWGKAIGMFPNAKILGVTATPERSDGKGLSLASDGFFEKMIVGPTMRDLIDMKYLTDYKIFAPESNIDLSEVDISATTGDYNKNKLVTAVKKSTITGDVVKHYLRIAKGKLGVTFCVDVEAATNTAIEFNAAGVSAAVISGKTPDIERAQILRDFKNRKYLQLVSVDILGEGFDLPAIEVISFARPTKSYGLYCLDPETEVLTPEGWKTYKDIDRIQEVMVFDPSSDKIIKTTVLSSIKRPLYKDENMYGISGPHLDINVSDKHDMIVSSKNSSVWIKEKAHEMAARKSLFKIPVAGHGEFKGCGLSKSELHLLGWYLSDGCINKKTNALDISQACNKTKHLDHIEKTLVRCGLKFGKCLIKRKNCPETHHDLVRFYVSKGKPRGTDKHLRGWGYLEKWLHKNVPPCYDDMTRDEFLILLESLNLGDGNNNHDSLDYIKRTLTITCGDNRQMADRLQAMCVMRGLRCNMATPHYDGYSMQYILHIRDCLISTIAGVNVKDGNIGGKKPYKRSRFKKLDYKPSFVWCLENEIGTLITRRNGKVAIVGNCQQFGRVLRILPGKEWAIIIDHVNNVMTHRLPDAYRKWSMERRPRSKKKKAEEDEPIPCKKCVKCTGVYEASLNTCPYCNTKEVPARRDGPKYVDGDLFELDFATLAAMRGEVEKIDRSFDDVRLEMSAKYMPDIGIKAAVNRQAKNQVAQTHLREKMAQWAGHRRHDGRTDSEIYRIFYHKFGVDMCSAQALSLKDAQPLAARLENNYLARN